MPDGSPAAMHGATPGASSAAAGELIIADGYLRYGSKVLFLTPKERSVLLVLRDGAGLPVPTDVLLEKVWAGDAVGPESLQRCVSTLRKKLSLLHHGPRILTNHGVGYRLVLAASAGLETPRETTDDPAAAEFFRQAMELAGRRTKPAIELALQRLHGATLRDPAFLPAYTMTAHGYITQAFHRHAPPRELGARTIGLCDRLLALAPESADAWAARGFARAVIFGDEPGFGDLDQAVAAEQPGRWLARLYRAWALCGRGEFDLAIADLEEAGRQNPGGLGLAGPSAYLLFCAGKPERALALLEQSPEAARHSASALSAFSIVASWLGRHEEAVSAGRRAAMDLEGSPAMAASLPCALARAGLRQEAGAELARITSDRAISPAPSLLAPVHLALGDQESALAALKDVEQDACVYRHLMRFDPRSARLFA